MRLHASVAAAALMLACGSDRIAAEEEGETDTSEDGCPPEPLSLPIPCVLESSCPTLYIEYGSYDVDHATCVLEALRDRKLGTYRFVNYTGFTYDEAEFQILDDSHAQRIGWQTTDLQECYWWEELGLLRTPEYYQECLDNFGADQWCLMHFLDEMLPDDSAACPAP